MASKLKSLWSRFWLKGSQFTGRYGNLEKLYVVEDPWNLSSEKEQARFERSNALIAQIAPGCSSLLEVGCGEGYQTAWLQKVSASVVGVDISARAIDRARKACPGVRFEVGRAEDVGALFKGERFDLVTAFETLYYASDTGAVVSELQALTNQLLVTNYAERMPRLAPYLKGAGWQELEPIEAGGTRWECRLWSRPDKS